MMVTYELKKGQKPTKEQSARIKEASKYPITFDEDSPETKESEISSFKRVNAPDAANMNF